MTDSVPPINKRRQRSKHCADGNRRQLKSDTLSDSDDALIASRIVRYGDLAIAEQIEMFACDARDVVFRLAEHESRAEKLAALQALLGKHAECIGIPTPVACSEGSVFESGARALLAEHESAVFSRGHWAIIVKATRLDMDFVSLAECARFANTIYHELRHAEQAFRVAQWRVEKTNSKRDLIVQQLRDELGLSEVIARAVLTTSIRHSTQWERTHPMSSTANTSLDEITHWAAEILPRDDGVCVSVAASRALAERHAEYMACAQELVKGYAEFRACNSARQWLVKPRVDKNGRAFRHAEEQLQQAFQIYASLAVERDAWSVGAAVERRLNPSGEIHSVEGELEKLLQNAADWLLDAG